MEPALSPLQSTASLQEAEKQPSPEFCAAGQWLHRLRVHGASQHAVRFHASDDQKTGMGADVAVLYNHYTSITLHRRLSQVRQPCTHPAALAGSPS